MQHVAIMSTCFLFAVLFQFPEYINVEVVMINSVYFAPGFNNTVSQLRVLPPQMQKMEYNSGALVTY